MSAQQPVPCEGRILPSSGHGERMRDARAKKKRMANAPSWKMVKSRVSGLCSDVIPCPCTRLCKLHSARHTVGILQCKPIQSVKYCNPTGVESDVKCPRCVPTPFRVLCLCISQSVSREPPMAPPLFVLIALADLAVRYVCALNSGDLNMNYWPQSFVSFSTNKDAGPRR